VIRPAPRADRRSVELERGYDEEDARVGGARTRAPEEGEQQRDAERTGRVEARQHRQAENPPDGGDRSRSEDERSCVPS